MTKQNITKNTAIWNKASYTSLFSDTRFWNNPQINDYYIDLFTIIWNVLPATRFALVLNTDYN